jgi:glycosyltransferase involved in cell wall biosynthesis
MDHQTVPNPHAPLTIVMGLLFYPRGGSAQVARYLSQSLIELGHQVHLVTGSLRDGNLQHDAEVFFAKLPLSTADYTAAWQGFTQGQNAISTDWSVPFHPSYEDKPGVPDKVFYKVRPEEHAALIRAWSAIFQDLSQTLQPDLMHLHHLNHVHLAAANAFPDIPRTTQLHGTEIKMLENMSLLGSEKNSADEQHRYTKTLLIDAARSVQHFYAISQDVRQRAMTQFSIEEPAITTLPNGVDTSLFKPLKWDTDQKLDFLRQILVEDPQGWDESGKAGSIRYTEADIEQFTFASGRSKPLLMFVGRFLAFKRVPLLLEAAAAVNDMYDRNDDWPPYNLLIWGGMPGEWEGEHPYALARRLELSNVFFSGWLPHRILSQGLNLGDVFVAPSFYEPFGQVFLEAMAAGLPVIGTRSGGPLSFVVDSGSMANGWLCEVDNQDSLAQAIFESLQSDDERQRRGNNALALIREHYSWLNIAKRYVDVYRKLIAAAL